MQYNKVVGTSIFYHIVIYYIDFARKAPAGVFLCLLLLWSCMIFHQIRTRGTSAGELSQMEEAAAGRNREAGRQQINNCGQLIRWSRGRARPIHPPLFEKTGRQFFRPASHLKNSGKRSKKIFGKYKQEINVNKSIYCDMFICVQNDVYIKKIIVIL